MAFPTLVSTYSRHQQGNERGVADVLCPDQAEPDSQKSRPLIPDEPHTPLPVFMLFDERRSLTALDFSVFLADLVGGFDADWRGFWPPSELTACWACI